MLATVTFNWRKSGYRFLPKELSLERNILKLLQMFLDHVYYFLFIFFVTAVQSFCYLLLAGAAQGQRFKSCRLFLALPTGCFFTTQKHEMVSL